MSKRYDARPTHGLGAKRSAVDGRREAAGEPAHDHDGGSNDHLASIYESREGQFATVVPYIRQGLAEGEQCVYVADDNTQSEVRAALRAGGVDVDAALASGALSIHTKADTYLRTDEFERDAMIEYWQESLAEAQDENDFEGFRAAAEMTWAVDEELDLDRLVRYEAILNTIYPGEDYVVLCQYNRNRFPKDVLSDVIRSHPLVAYEGTVCRNFYYDPPEEFFGDDRPMLDLDRTIEGLLESEQTRRTLDERERRLTALTDVTGDLMDATPREVCERVVEIACDTFGAQLGAMWLYDATADDLRLSAADGPQAGRDGSGADRFADIAWETLTDGEVTVHDDVGSAVGTGPGHTSDGAGIFVPMKRHGVFMVGSEHAAAFDSADVDFIETLAATTEAALDRAERESTLRDRESELERKTEALERLEEINAIIREVDRALVQAESREEIERAVCERLTDEDRFTFAWIGETDAPREVLVPTGWAGTERGYLDAVTLDVSDDENAEPSVCTTRSDEVTVAPNVIDDLDAGGWASRALSAGFHSIASIPLSYDGVQYGVLSVYADRSSAFDGQLASVLGELGDTIAYAMNATQRKQALLTDAVTELEFEIEDPSCPILSIARTAGCSIELRDVLARPEDGVLALVTVPASALDQVLAAVENSTAMDAARPVAETDDGWLVQLSAAGSLIAEDLADHGAQLETMTVDEASVRICVAAPSTHPQAIVEMIKTAYPGAELLARRNECEQTTRRGDSGRFWDQLTDRQREVAQLAYYGGYFERPRDHTGEELAERLGVSPQAFHKHLRRIQRTLFATTLEDDPASGG